MKIAIMSHLSNQRSLASAGHLPGGNRQELLAGVEGGRGEGEEGGRVEGEEEQDWLVGRPIVMTIDYEK